jgi:hypothetical protein
VLKIDRALFAAGLLNFLALAGALVAGLVDDRLILGINPWIKPAKFFASIGIYLVTVAWMVTQVRTGSLTRAVLRWTFIVTMIGEGVLIAMQSARGVTSHFNHTTPFDAMVFRTMGGLIALNTVAAFGLLLRFVRSPRPMPRAVLSGIRWGLVLFLLASAVGGLMVSAGSHAIGVPDGGPGLPFVNWSTEGGDLRIAHFVGLHALQGLPILGWMLSRRSPGASAGTVRLAAAAWAALFAGLLWTALNGRAIG